VSMVRRRVGCALALCAGVCFEEAQHEKHVWAVSWGHLCWSHQPWMGESLAIQQTRATNSPRLTRR
jgi:hypothetical protein